MLARPAQLDLLDDIPPLRSRRRAQFVAAILSGKTSREAVASAGYAAQGHSADVAASRLLKKDDIALHLAIGRRIAIETAGVNAAQIVREACRIALAEKASFGGGLVVRMPDKIAALRLLFEHLGLTRPAGVDLNVSVGARIEAAVAGIDAGTAVALAEILEEMANGGAPPLVAAPSPSPGDTSHNPNSWPQPQPMPASTPDAGGCHSAVITPNVVSGVSNLDTRTQQPGRGKFLEIVRMRAGADIPLRSEFYALGAGLQDALIRFVAPTTEDHGPATPDEIVAVLERASGSELHDLLAMMDAADGSYIDEAGVGRRSF
jgi:hypothetical protein